MFSQPFLLAGLIGGLTNHLAFPNFQFLLQTTAGVVSPAHPFLIAEVHGILFGEGVVVMPVAEDAFDFAVNDWGFQELTAIGIPFVPESIGEIIAGGFANLDLAVGEPAFGQAVEEAIGNDRTGHNAAVGLSFQQNAGDRVGVAHQTPKLLPTHKVGAGNFDQRSGRDWYPRRIDQLKEQALEIVTRRRSIDELK